MMVNNFTKITKAKNHLAPQLIERYWCMNSLKIPKG